MSIGDLAPQRYPALWRWIIERVWRVEHAFERAHADGRAENDTRIRIFVVLTVFTLGFCIMAGGAFWSATFARTSQRLGAAAVPLRADLVDREGRLLHRSESPGRGQVMAPTHWTAGDLDLALVSADPRHGGLLDGHGRTVVRFPDDGHPVECCTALDLTGDHRDEVVCWDGDGLAIYAAEDGERPDPGPRRMRLPLYNTSNYRAEVSRPGTITPDRRGPP